MNEKPKIYDVVFNKIIKNLELLIISSKEENKIDNMIKASETLTLIKIYCNKN